MADTISNELYRMFLEAAGEQASGLSETRYALEEVLAQLDRTQQPAPAQTVKASSGTQTQSDSGGASSAVVQVLKNGFGVAPLIGGLISLFTGGSDEPAPLVKYALPAAVNFQAAEQNGRMTTADYDQAGMARAYAARPSIAPQITVNVQAMDSRSFLDRSGDIAMAVRDAMLNLNSINDVVNDL